ncbi:GNAT family N-acetyltransferase [Arhodomonas sp. AD133]|uniref:GNAT family N-acetyltransferase n=1 Tax=Arhodomonas sp. AD133 TaxID=3415009 RepID=UPI003EB7B522
MNVAETRRLLLRELTLDDLPGLAAILADPAVMRYSIGGVLSEVETRHFLEWTRALYRDEGFGPWAVVEKATTALVGFCGLSPTTVNDKPEVHVGYRFARSFWGRGIATEAVTLVLDHAFGRRRLTGVVALIEPDHRASQRVAEKAGFHLSGLAQYHGRAVRVYRQTRPAWQRERRRAAAGVSSGGGDATHRRDAPP